MTVTGVDDRRRRGGALHCRDGPRRPAAIRTERLKSFDVSVTNTDKRHGERHGDADGGPTTTEGGGTGDVSPIVLTSQPTANVTVPASLSSNTAEAMESVEASVHQRELEHAPDRDGHRCRRFIVDSCCRPRS